MLNHKGLCNSKAKTRTALRLGILALHLFEGIADLAKRALRDADAGIGDGDENGAFDLAGHARISFAYGQADLDRGLTRLAAALEGR